MRWRTGARRGGGACKQLNGHTERVCVAGWLGRACGNVHALSLARKMRLSRHSEVDVREGACEFN